ncbi:MAG: SRPBCC family protein [Caulobacteraceae bacterium]
MKRLLSAAAIGAGLMAAAPAFAADYATIKLDTTVNAPVETVWAKVGGYCAIQDWLKRLAPCVMTGDGGLGSIRKLGAQGNIVEVMVAATKYSYTYAQPTTPGLGILYHGTLSAEPIDKGHTKLMYSLIYDQEPDGTQEAKDKDRAGRTANFTAALATMKALAEGK